MNVGSAALWRCVENLGTLIGQTCSGVLIGQKRIGVGAMSYHYYSREEYR